VLIILSSWGSQLGGHLHAIKQFFGAVAGEKENFYKGSLSPLIFYFVIVLLYFILFLLASFYQKYKKKITL
jgi:hypothetical protein